MSTATLARAYLPLDANWRLLGNCLDLDPDFMHPYERDRSGEAAARDACQGCPVKDKCLDDAIDTGDWNGIRGGMTGAERRRHVAGDPYRVCIDCRETFIPRIHNQKRCRGCASVNDGHHYGAPRRECATCGASARIDEATGQLYRHKTPGKGNARPLCRGEATSTEQEQAANTCVTCELPEDRWDTSDRLYICGGIQCPGCSRADLDTEKLIEHAEVSS